MSSQSQSVITVPEKFYKPFYKLTLAQLAEAKKVESEWKVKLKGLTDLEVTLHMVWLQGCVESVGNIGDTLILSEEGKQVTVVGLSATPGGANWVKAGQYVQVIGQFKDVVQGETKIECKTLRDLSSCRIAKDLWPLEVAELHNLLTGKISISD